MVQSVKLSIESIESKIVPVESFMVFDVMVF